MSKAKNVPHKDLTRYDNRAYGFALLQLQANRIAHVHSATRATIGGSYTYITGPTQLTPYSGSKPGRGRGLVKNFSLGCGAKCCSQLDLSAKSRGS
jgi:hypothetical protein